MSCVLCVAGCAPAAGVSLLGWLQPSAALWSHEGTPEANQTQTSHIDWAYGVLTATYLHAYCECTEGSESIGAISYHSFKAFSSFTNTDQSHII